MARTFDTSADVLAHDEIVWPDFVGGFGPNYRECCYVAVMRFWQLFEELGDYPDESDTLRDYEEDHGAEIHAKVDEIGLSTFQAPSAFTEAKRIVTLGFVEWQKTWFNLDAEAVIWSPTTEFKWTDRKQAEDMLSHVEAPSKHHHQIGSKYPDLFAEAFPDVELDTSATLEDMDDV